MFVEAHTYHFISLYSLNHVVKDVNDDSDLVADVDPDGTISHSTLSNNKFHHLRMLVNMKWGPSPTTILQVCKQCIGPIFEYVS